MARYHIEKEQNIQDKTEMIYYEGSHRWTTEYSDRKTYTTKADATADLYDFGGTVITE
jgi:hypothetical protein